MTEVDIGRRCLTGAPGSWVEATVVGRFPDGTFVVRPDVPDISFMPDWFGVTAIEISIDDRAQWKERFSAFGHEMSREDLRRAFTDAGTEVDDALMERFWSQSVSSLFGLGPDVRLDEEQAYAVVRQAGWSAAVLSRPMSPYFRLWWNQTRMGGRHPDEVGREIGVEEVLEALGLTGAPLDASAASALAQLEARLGAAVPAAVAAVVRRVGFGGAVHAAHPNNPSPIPAEEWQARRVDGEVRVTIIEPHQGDHCWQLAWRDGDADARVYVAWEPEDGAETRLLTAPSFLFFLWDLAQTGGGWFDAHPRSREA